MSVESVNPKDINQLVEIQRELHVTREQLLYAMEIVGTSTRILKEYLEQFRDTSLTETF
ncbi:DUF3606 domain-containing protein [Pedobacter antarcticus]|uniref:DUF3606 domain-containing protein n=1 Tax=Pedobacter antarcticus TaxID=34086 RepID=UPI001C588E5A|nr:DUF3606 domain-containing protein [Pedobacter antarcticus]